MWTTILLPLLFFYCNCTTGDVMHYKIFYLSGRNTMSVPKPISINNKGDIVGHICQGKINELLQACLWKSGISRPEMIGRMYYRAQAIDDDENIAGVTGTGKAFWLTKGHFHFDEVHSLAYGIDKGIVVGERDLEQSRNTYHAVLWNGHHMVDLGTPAELNSGACCVNHRAEIVGFINTRNDEAHAFIWKAGRITDLGTLGGPNSGALSINNSGEVVGWSNIKSGDRKNCHAFLWRKGKMIDLGTSLTGDSESISINDHGDILIGNEHKFFVFHNGRLFDLDDIVDGVQSLENISVYKINNRCEMIGNAEQKGKRVGFVLSPTK